jgi:DNA-binding NarL/FixJ family response regulator
MPIRVAVVEDDKETRDNLSQWIESSASFYLMRIYTDAESALEGFLQLQPDVVLMDIDLPGMDGMECVRQLKPRLPDTQFLMLTAYEDNDRLFKSLMAGATGYLLKRTSSRRLLSAMREAYEGGSPMTPRIARRVVQHFHQEPEPASELTCLTPREKDVLEQLARGFRYKEIVNNLHISNGTLHSHICNIYEKLRVHSRTEAVVKYLGR